MSDTAPSQQETSHTYSVGRFLYLTAAINGGVILIIEILGAKMLSPFWHLPLRLDGSDCLDPDLSGVRLLFWWLACRP